MIKFKNEKGEVAIMFGGADENFALSIINPGVVLDWVWDPQMIQMVLDYNKVSVYDNYNRFVGDRELCIKIENAWNKYIKDTYQDILKEEYDDQSPFPSIDNVDILFLKEGTEFVIIDRNFIDVHSYGEEILITKTLKA